jgi:3-methylcrotonyl-CoA carboxylase alpha subunit
MKITKLLVANRGEIAIRVFRTCRELGIKTVAVYSEADAESLHTQFADESVLIGAPEASESYLSIPKILAAAKETGANAIHPGYGFLSERAEFADACQKAGIVFVGPSGAAMRALGEKISAKSLAVAANVPIVPGFFKPGASPDRLAQEAAKVGYPIMLKASAGGGGRGMRVVRNADEFQDALNVASSEALKAFGDGTMMVEKLVERPRHVEVQVLADAHGNVACLFERECSIQRRHQKLLEEAPSPLLVERPEVWTAMQVAAKAVTLKAGYQNAGTVEFILDPETGAFYFLEVNARLQVEHPVTEAITGLDLVREQIRIAEGEPLQIDPFLMNGDRQTISGHSIEARIIAEDPERNFLPSIGKILAWSEPLDSRIRVDAGFDKGATIPQFYDSLIAKVIVHGNTRLEAITRLRSALMDFHILGVKTNISYLLNVIEHPEFQSGDIDTGFLARHFSEWHPKAPDAELGPLSLQPTAMNETVSAAVKPTFSVWGLDDGFRVVR